MNRIDFGRYRELEAEGLLYIQKHPEADLFIHNYSQYTQFERVWIPETLNSRGLITTGEGMIVARPFAKFFNFGEQDLPIPNEPFEVFEKMDGSLGILYFLDGEPQIATRGSFISEQSERANAIFRRKYAHIPLDPSITYLFEIIYPENRIVVNYGETEDLILLGMVETATGRELPLAEIGFPVVKKYSHVDDLARLAEFEEENREGFVVRFQNGYRLKFKFEEYKRLHKVMTRVTPLTIWEVLKSGGDFSELAEIVPDEFFGWVRTIQAELQAQYDRIEAEAKAEFRTFDDRKAAAEYYQQCKYPAILFRMLDGRDYAEYIWRLIRPADNQLSES